jgi:preprotein translocase subunit SecD
VIPRLRRTTTALLVVPAVLALAGCSISTTTSAAPVSVAPTPSESPTQVLDLQLRPVLDIATATAGQCAATASPPPSPDPVQPAQVCSQDRTLLLSLGPAAVTGTQVTGLDATMTSRQPQLQVKLDAQGGAALTRVTAEGMTQAPPRNQLALVSHGRVQSAPTISEAIDGSIIVFTGFTSVDDAQKALDFLTS